MSPKVLSTRKIDAQSGDDSIEVGSESCGGLIAISRTQYPEKRFLRDVFGVRRVAEETVSRIPCRGLVPCDDLPEGGEVSTGHGKHQFLVTRREHVRTCSAGESYSLPLRFPGFGP